MAIAQQHRRSWRGHNSVEAGRGVAGAGTTSSGQAEVWTASAQQRRGGRGVGGMVKTEMAAMQTTRLHLCLNFFTYLHVFVVVLNIVRFNQI